ncbi:hypothetical protein HPB47_003382 [Ixodes persulcatus]|uniref:Uncharacterized protein n=1 Tax=Ixodes persulcatus TaxID=34615 RepID=A0AC60PII0_IXOPE|nr:hypothetical protein HPB47_003382 [Ixodes persulcatus]
MSDDGKPRIRLPPSLIDGGSLSTLACRLAAGHYFPLYSSAGLPSSPEWKGWKFLLNMNTEQLLDQTAEAVSGRNEFPFTIAKELGHETKILVTTPNDEDYDIEVEDSNGKVCAACNVTLGKQSTNIDMPRTSTTDTWRLVVKPKAASIANITVVVLSKQRVPGQDPIRAESSVEYNNQQTRVYSKVTKGTAAVLGALVTATVTFGGPGGTGETLQLLDNGIGADNLKDDGDYSAFFTQLKGAGRYSVRTDVKVTKNTRLGPYKGAKPQPAEPSTPSERSGPPGPSGGSGTSGSSGSLVASASGTWPPDRFVTKLFNPGDAVACGPSAECKKQKGHHVAMNSGHSSHARQTEERVNEELSLVAYAGSVQVKSDLMREDLPPAPIRDLVVSEAALDDEEMTATLSWTSMARAVDIRAGSHPRVLLFTFNNATPISEADVLEGSLEPLEPYK